MNSPWRIEMLGWLRVVGGDRVVSRFRSHQTGALLAYLAYHQHRAHTREALIELFWPECDPRDGRNRLSVALSSLRRQLEPPGVPAGAVILANRTTVQLNPSASSTDVARFDAALQSAGRNRNTTERAERLAEAVTLYQGELLPGYCEAWVLAERQRLAEAFHQALHQLIALLQQAGNLPDALRYARMAAGADPLREETHHDLIRLLVAGGQPEAALRQYQELERLLARELHAAPAPGTRDLAEQISGRSGPSTAAGSLDHPRSPSLLPDGAPLRHYPDESSAPDLREIPPPQAAPAHAGSLPVQFTRFFGREAEIEQLCSMLFSPPTSSSRLVTLTGPGGSGKTRLAVEAAQRLGEKWGESVWFVPLVDLADPRLIADQSLYSLRLPRSPDLIPLEQVVAFLSRKPALLLLDNFEHLVESGAEDVQALLTRVPSLTVLVTSRRRLDLPGEREFPVPALPIPGIQDEVQSSPEYLIRCPSVQLFVDRAQAIRPDFQVTRGNATDVAALCARLEGLPLAIELAAARAGVLTPAQMVPRLEQRFELLTTRRRAADARHQSLRAALDWSYQLLSPELQRFFARLSVFRGGWTLQAAEAVCMGAGEPADRPPGQTSPSIRTADAVDLLASLADNSLLRCEERGGREPRFTVLETIREYGQECLAMSGEGDAVRRQHAEYFLALAEAAEPELGRDAAWLDRLESEHDNLRAALDWCSKAVDGGQWAVGSSGQGFSGAGPDGSGLPTAHCSLPTVAEIGLRLSGALWWFWDTRSHFTEARQRLETVLAGGAGAGTAIRRKALCAAAYLGAQADATQTLLAEESLALCRQAADSSGIGWSLMALLAASYRQKAIARVPALAAEALSFFREAGDRRGMIYALEREGQALWMQGHRDRGEALLEESLALCRSEGYRCCSTGALRVLGISALDAGHTGRARALLEESLAITREFGSRSGSAWTLHALARVAQWTGDDARAALLFEESLTAFRSCGTAVGSASALVPLGDLALARGEIERAELFFEEAWSLAKIAEDKIHAPLALLGLASVALAQGDHARARAQFEQAQPPGPEVGERGLSSWLVRQGDLLLEFGDTARARSRYEEGLALRRAGGYPGLIAHALLAVGHAAWCEENHVAARTHAQEALGLFQQQDNPVGVLAALEILASAAGRAGNGRGGRIEDLTDEEWERVVSLLPAATRGRGRPYREHRRVIDGIRWKLRTGVAWRDLPARYGPWHTCHNRYARWQREGLWDRITAALQSDVPSAE